MVRRRSVLLTGLGLAGAACGPAWGGDDPPLRAEIECNGRVYRFSEGEGADLGDYADPAGRFVQTCRLARDPGLPAMAVLFRRDRGTGRAEIVFERGRPWAKPAEATDLGRYQARIFRGDTRLGAVDVPRHFWFSRWRWQSAVRPVRVNIASLVASGLLPPLEMPAIHRKRRPEEPHAYAAMGLAGLTAYMGATGDRAEIGPVTEYQAEYVCTGSRAALNTMMAQAEAGGTVPWNIRDERTGAPVDTLAYPRATLYSERAGSPFIPMPPDPAIHPDSAHQPALAYLPFVLTGDPYHLETLQFQAAWNILSLPADYRYTIPQVRAHAWSLRTLAQAARMTPAQVPRWLLPQSEWRRHLARQHDWVMAAFVTRSEPERSVFRSVQQDGIDRAAGPVPPGTYIQSWQDDFHAFVLAWLVMMGFEEWREVFRWKIGSTLARTDGRSGWVRAVCSPYALMLRRTAGGPACRSWPEAWALNDEVQRFGVRNPDAVALDDTYFPIARAALAMAAHLGERAAGPSLAWANAQQRRQYEAGTPFQYKWAVP